MAKEEFVMDEADAQEYLERKGKIKATYNNADKAKIKKVMKEGKIFGDPTAELSITD